MDVTLDAGSAEKLKALLDRGVFSSASEALASAVELLDAHCPDDWLWQNREYVRAAIDESYEAEARGEIYTPEQMEAMLDEARGRRRQDAA